MKILVLTQKFSGCGYHRLMLPVSFMPKEYGRITDTITEEELAGKKYDIVFVNRVWEKDDLIELRKKYGFKLVVDVDDYWILNHDHLMFDSFNATGFASKLIRYMREADMVTCTHYRLAEAVAVHNSNVIVVPNSIPYGQGQFNGERVATDGVKIFWAGGITHDQDLKILEAPMKRVEGNVQMVLGGYADSNETERYYWGRMANYFTADKQLPYTLMRGKEVFEYYELFKYADIMLIPLVKNNFNKYKSNIKILEAAGKAVPVVVSAVHPYLDFPDDVVNYVHDRADWNKHIDRLVNDKELRDEQGAILHEYCSKYYNFNEINETRRKSFEALLS
jgi:glycosyltransferase involved in cell wall biosynthesis